MSDNIATNGAPPVVEHAPSHAAGVPTRNGLRCAPRTAPKRRGAEPYDALVWRLQSRHGGNATESQAIGLVGSEARTGVTTVAANVAVRASELQLGPVLLVEADMERPKLRSAWKLPPGPGLAELLTGEAAYADCLRDGPAHELHVIPAAAGRIRQMPVWVPSVLDALLAEAAADHSLVLFDLPSVDRLHHAALLARRLDQMLLVVRAEHTRAPAAQRTVERLIEDGMPLSGVVLNRQRGYVPRWLKHWF